MEKPLVIFDQLRIDVRVTRSRRLRIVDSATFNIEKGQLLGLIGESGSGKTMLCRSLVGTLRRRGAYIESGKLKKKTAKVGAGGTRPAGILHSFFLISFLFLIYVGRRMCPTGIRH